MEPVSETKNLTVKELAEELGKTPQGINKYLRKSGLQDKAIKDGNRFLIPADLADEIRNHFGNVSETETKTETKVSKETKEERSSDVQAVEALVKQLEILQRQLEIKDKQIETLTEALAVSNETNRILGASNFVQTATDKRDLLLVEAGDEQKPEKKKGFWSRIFG